MISVIIPVYNAEPYLRRCLNSVLSSTYREFELILVNDGSTDNSFEICQEYAAKDKRIQVISQENRGVSAARNRGLDICRGEWVVFVDADDVISPDFLGLIAQEEFQSQDLLLFDFSQTEPEFAVAHPVLETLCFGPKDIPELLRGLMLRRQLIENGNLNLLSPCGKAYRKAIIEEHAIRFDPGLSFGEDQLFNVEYLTVTRHCTYFPTPVYYYDIHLDSSSHRFNPKLPYNLSEFLKEIQAVLDTSHLLPMLEKEFYSNALQNLNYTLVWSVFSPDSTSSYCEKIQICRTLRKNGLYCRAMEYNQTCKNLSSRIILCLFRLRCYHMVGILARLCNHFLSWKSRR